MSPILESTLLIARFTLVAIVGVSIGYLWMREERPEGLLDPLFAGFAAVILTPIAGLAVFDFLHFLLFGSLEYFPALISSAYEMSVTNCVVLTFVGSVLVSGLAQVWRYIFK